MAFSRDLKVLGRLLRKFCMLFKASIAVPEVIILTATILNNKISSQILIFHKYITFYHVNDTETKQRWYVIGNGCVYCDGPAHTVSNDHNGRWALPIEGLYHLANIPFKENQ